MPIPPRMQHNNVFGKSLIVLSAVTVIFIFLLHGCGKKGPPVPPMQGPPPAISDLSASVDGDVLRLTWTIPSLNSAGLEGCMVYKSAEPVSGEKCNNCPIKFKKVADIKITEIRAAAPEDSRMTYTEPLKKGYRYIYKVVVYNTSGSYGKDSNYADFIY